MEKEGNDNERVKIMIVMKKSLTPSVSKIIKKIDIHCTRTLGNCLSNTL